MSAVSKIYLSEQDGTGDIRPHARVITARHVWLGHREVPHGQHQHQAFFMGYE